MIQFNEDDGSGLAMAIKRECDKEGIQLQELEIRMVGVEDKLLAMIAVDKAVAKGAVAAYAVKAIFEQLADMGVISGTAIMGIGPMKEKE